MALLILASSTDIDRWASTRRAQEQLPELIRRLVHATTSSPALVDMPSGDAITLAGPDGVVELEEDHPYIPRGISIWEMGADVDPKRKADEDFRKRSDSQILSRKGRIASGEAGFVFVTPRRWPGKQRWAEERRAEGRWTDVRALDAVDLEGWAQQAPGVHVWLSRALGLIPHGADDLETVWHDLAESFTPHATPDLFLAGREDEAAEILNWLKGERAGTLTVTSESTTDVVGVIGAAIASLPDEERLPLSSRTVAVSSVDALAQLSASPEPLIFLCTYQIGDEIQRALRTGHKVLLPTTANLGGKPSGAQVTLPRPVRSAVEKALLAMGLDDVAKARELAGVARRSMLTLRRRLATHPVIESPKWAHPEVGPSLIPILLLGQFDEKREADLGVLERLSPASSSAARQALLRWAQDEDPPVRRVGTVWYLVSKHDAWAQLSRFLTQDDMNLFRAAALDVLMEVHPKYDLPADQRWAASIHGKERRYSGTLVHGVAETIALMGAISADTLALTSVTPSQHANRIVRELFAGLAGDWRAWATLSPYLPLLAEGSPDSFLEALEAQVARHEETVRTLFGDQGDPFFGSSTHTGILWALEVLAWSPDHLGYVSLLLARLDRLDPGGRLANRPANSLRSIFLHWLPQTSADLDTRLAVLDELRKAEPDAGRRLLTALIPRGHDHSGYNPRPRWRDWGGPQRPTSAEISRQVSAVVRWLLEDAGVDPTRWVVLVAALDKLQLEHFQEITSALETALQGDITDEFRAPVADALRELVGRHRSFREADWALPEDLLGTVDKLYARAIPHDLVLRHRWLFSDRPQLPEGREQDWREHQSLVQGLQQQALSAIYDEGGTGRVLELAGRVDRPDEVGRGLGLMGVISPDDETALLSAIFRSSDRAHVAFGRGYTAGWTQRAGRAEALTIIRERAKWDDFTRANLLLAQRLDAQTLDLVDDLDDQGKKTFWSSAFAPWFDEGVIERALRRLLEYGRPLAVIHAAAMYLRTIPDMDPDLLATALNVAPTMANEENGLQVDAHDVGELLDALERAAKAGRFEEGRLAQLEFLYLPALGHFNRPPRTLHKELAANPGLFVELIRATYRAKGAEPKELDPREAQLATNAHHLLDSWRQLPGGIEGRLDASALNQWIDRVRADLRTSGHLEVGDLVIGQVLSGCGFDADRAWPIIPVRALVERLASDDLEAGLQMGRYNSRGVISRDPSAGGDLERGEAANYESMAAVVGIRWPRTAAMLRRMARSAMHDANREDIESELREDLER